MEWQRVGTLLLSMLLAAGSSAIAQTNNQCDQPGETPDIIVGDIGDEGIGAGIRTWGSAGGVTAYSIGGNACNIGTCWESWNGNEIHPVIGQNVFRLKDGRFEQIGQSWVKHVFAAENEAYCGGTCIPADGLHLGVGCSDLYHSTTNGVQSTMGVKAGVNPHTGEISSSSGGDVNDIISRRLQVRNSDLDPPLNPGAKYFAELQYVAPDDATAGNGDNNVSYRSATVRVTAGLHRLFLTGPTIIGQPAILAWRSIDPSVVVSQGNLPGDGRIFVAAKATWLGGGIWQYEYAVQNVDSDAAPVAISIPIPGEAHVSQPGFHDVDYHSGDPQEGRNWTVTVGGDAIVWKAYTLVLNDVRPNLLRWGTLYNFRFKSDAPPASRPLTLGFSSGLTPPFTVSLAVSTLAPSLCDADGVCDPGETCASCSADCDRQGGGSGCCGNGVCEAGEDAGACFADCGTPLAAETLCGDGVDGDRDGLTDCFDADCCTDTACDAFDADGDGRTALCDCSDSEGSAWAIPGEVHALALVRGSEGTVLSWSPLAEPGGALVYEAIRSTDPVDFAAHSSCLETTDPSATSATDPVVHPEGAVFYLVRARNACPSGTGPLGESSSGVPHEGPPACP